MHTLLHVGRVGDVGGLHRVALLWSDGRGYCECLSWHVFHSVVCASQGAFSLREHVPFCFFTRTLLPSSPAPSPDVVMEQFRWGPEFLRINAELLDAYAAASSSDGVVAVQAAWMKKLEAEARARRSRARDLPPEDSGSEGEEAEGTAEGRDSVAATAVGTSSAAAAVLESGGGPGGGGASSDSTGVSTSVASASLNEANAL